MNAHTKISELMSHEPVWVDLDARPSEVRATLSLHGFHHLPVMKGSTLVGVVSAFDLARISLGAWMDDQQTATATIDATFALADVMTHEPETVYPTDTVKHAADLLAEGNYHCLPVLDQEGNLIGMLTTTDVLRWLVNA